jgi:O-antigen/teichoic acid export membrane protein
MKLLDSTLRNVLLSALAGGAGWALAALAPLVTTPVMLSHLGDYRYGAWMVLSAIAGMMMLSDFGITNGITSRLAQTQPGDEERRQLVSNAYVLLFFFSLILAVLLLGAYVVARSSGPPLLDAPLMTDTMTLMMLAVLLPTALNVPLGFVVRLLYVDMRGSEASLAPGIAALLSVPIAFFGARTGMDPFLLVLLFLSTAPFTYLCLSVHYFRKPGTLRPTLADHDRNIAFAILRSGLRFVPLSLLVILCNKLDYMIVARFQGVENVVSYAIADRIIGIVNAMVTVLSATLWPIFAREIGRGNLAWVKATIIKLNVMIVVFYALFLALLLWKYNQVVEIWLGRPVHASTAMLIFLTLGSMMLALASPYFAVANCLGAVKEQLLAYLVLLAIGFPAKLMAGTYFGSAGIAAGGFASWALIMLPAIVITARRCLNKVAR